VVLGSGRTKKDELFIRLHIHGHLLDGRITACGCADIEADALAIGNAAEDSLSDVWSGNRRIEIFDSFVKGKLAKICRNCSAYLPDANAFSRPYFREYGPHQPLPLEFFHQFWGG